VEITFAWDDNFVHTNLGKIKFVSGMFTSYYAEEVKTHADLCLFLFILFSFFYFYFSNFYSQGPYKIHLCMVQPPFLYFCAKICTKCQNPLFFFLGCILLVLGEFFFQISKKEELPYFDLDFSLGLTTLVLYPFRFGLGLEMKDSVSERGSSFTTAHAVRFGLG